MLWCTYCNNIDMCASIGINIWILPLCSTFASLRMKQLRSAYIRNDITTHGIQSLVFGGTATWLGSFFGSAFCCDRLIKSVAAWHCVCERVEYDSRRSTIHINNNNNSQTDTLRSHCRIIERHTHTRSPQNRKLHPVRIRTLHTAHYLHRRYLHGNRSTHSRQSASTPLNKIRKSIEYTTTRNFFIIVVVTRVHFFFSSFECDL